MKLFKIKLILIAAILIIGLFLRIHNLGKESFWLDEGFSIKISNLNMFKIIEESANKDLNPPLYYIVLHFWINLFGDSEFSARFLSVIFGGISILMIYKVGGMIFNKNIGILSSMILGLSAFHIQYSQEARNYSLMVLLTLLSFYFFIRLLNKRSLMISAYYIMFSILLIYTHVFGLFVIISQNIYLFTLYLLSKSDRKINLRKWVLLQIILVVLYTPWINILINKILSIHSGSMILWIPTPTIHSIISTFKSYSGSILLLSVFLILLFLSIVNYKKNKGKIIWEDLLMSIEGYSWNISLSNINRNYLLLVWLMTPIILLFVISKISAPIYTNVYTISASIPFYILVANGIENIGKKPVMLYIIILIIAFSLVNTMGYYKIRKEPWREVTKFIEINAKSGDLLLFDSGVVQEWIFDYYSKRTDLIKKPFAKKSGDIYEENVKELEPTVERFKRVWLILSHSRDYNRLIPKTLNKSYFVKYHKEYVGIEVYLFRKKE